jgi:hypothetical protein
METTATTLAEAATQAPGKSFAQAVDRWIYVFMAASFIAYTLLGFVPDSLAKIAAVDAGQRPPFPLSLHAHAILMGAFLLLLAQSLLAATGRLQYHRTLGIAAFVLGPALVIVGLILVPTMYHQVWDAAQSAPPGIRPMIEQGLREFDNIILVQLRVGVLFPIFLAIALAARRSDPGLHKRMMFLAVAPMFIWDLVRTQRVHKAYLIWVLVSLSAAILVHTLWDSEWWHATARRLIGV